MPSIFCRSKLRAVSDHYSLNLNARHRLVVGAPSDTLYPMNKTRFPECVDVRLSSNLVVTLSGTVDGSEIPAAGIIGSSLAQHLVDYLQTNANSLGLNTISKLWIDDEDGLLKLTLTPSRQYLLKPELLPVHVLLVGLDLCYSWQTSTPSVADAQPQWRSHPFSQRLSLPFRTLLDNAVGRFVTWQLVKRYPLIFGQWCQQLDIEASFFPPIFSSILTIMKRSPNPAFRTKCQRLIKAIRRRHAAAISEASSRLADYLREIPEADSSFMQVGQPLLKDEDVLCLAMERVYRDGMRRRQFKGLGRAPDADRADDEDLSQDYTLLPQHPTQFDEQLLWNDCSAKPPSHAWMNPFLFGDPTSCSPPPLGMDMELSYDDQDPLDDDPWSDPHDLSLDSADDHDPSYYELNLVGNGRVPVPMDVDLQDDECVILPAAFEFSDDDLFDPFQLDIQTCPDADQDDFAESEIQYFLHDHVLSQVDGYEQNSEVVAEHEIGLVSHARILSQSPGSSVTEPVSCQEGDSFNSQESDTLALKQPQLTPWPEFREESLHVPLRFPIDAALYHSIDVGMLSDTDSISSHSLGTASEEDYDLEEFDDSRGDLVPAHLGLLGKDRSHPVPTLLVTCPSEKYQQEEHQEDGEAGEPRLEQDFESGGVSADRNVEARMLFPIEDWGEDALLVVDF